MALGIMFTKNIKTFDDAICVITQPFPLFIYLFLLSLYYIHCKCMCRDTFKSGFIYY